MKENEYGKEGAAPITPASPHLTEMIPPMNPAPLSPPLRIFSRQLRVEEPSQVGEARRMAGALGRALGFDETRTGQAELIATELATNLLKHTGGAGGVMVFSPIREAAAVGLDLLSLDHGLGIAHLGQWLRDGYSTTGSAGLGLGAIQRLSSLFELFSAPGQGTAVFSRLWNTRPPARSSALTVGAVCLPVDGEQACGDAWALQAHSGSTRFLLADGLGHGPQAAAAANLAVDLFEKHPAGPPAQLLHLLHGALQSTRGAAVAVADVDPVLGQVRFAGLGNISALILAEGNARHLVSNNGTAGAEARTIQEFTYPWPKEGLLVLHSDGVATHWALEHYPGLVAKHPALIAGVLWRDHQRRQDDSTVLVAKAAGRRDES